MSKIIDKVRFTLTSIGLAAALAASPCSMVKASSAENGNEYSYDIKYIYDESQAAIDDNYDEELIEKYRNAPDDMVVEIPEHFKYCMSNYTHKGADEDITVSDLRSLKRLNLYSFDDEEYDMSWLNYCSGLEKLDISSELLNYMGDVVFLDNLKSFSTSSSPLYDWEDCVNFEKCGFLNNSNNLDEVRITGYYYPEQVYNLKAKRLVLDVGNIYTIDYTKLNSDYLKELVINGAPYDVAMNLSNADIDFLEKNGVSISFGQVDGTTMEKVREINDKLDIIVESLGLDENATDEEKVRAVLIYVLSNLEYDDYASECQEKGINFDHEPFYQGGELYGALERDTHICGNYAALTSALLSRVGVNDYYVTSDSHAWNLVEVDGEWYYFDSTWLDDDKVTVWEEEWEDIPGGKSLTITSIDQTVEEALASGNEESIDQLVWYKVLPSDYKADPEKYYDIKDKDDRYSHEVVNFPITIVEVKTENTDSNVVSEEEHASSITDATSKDTSKVDKNFGQKLFDVTIGNKIFRRVSAGALIGLFVSLGIAIPVRINRKKKEEKERNRQMNDMFYDSTYNLSGRRNRNRTGTYFDPNDNQYGGNSRLL